MAEVNPFDIEFAEEDKPSKKLGVFEKAVSKIKDGIPLNETEENVVEEVLDEEEPLDVPEIETEVVDLPPEDENEKEIVVDNNPTDATIGDGVEEITPDDVQLDGEVEDGDGEFYENAVRGEEVGDSTVYPSDENVAEVKDTKRPEESNEDTEEKEETKEEPTEEKKEPMSDEDVLKEAQELAKDDSTTNNSKSYEHYPVELKVASMLGNAVQTAGEDVGNVARTVGKEGTNSGSIANEVARAVPHFDYRSLFR